MFETLLETVPPPRHDPQRPLQAWVTNLDASPYVGRIAMCRVMHGTISRGSERGLVPHRRHHRHRPRSPELYVTESLHRVDAAEAGAGEIIAISGIADITIGRDARRPRKTPCRCPGITVDEPSLSITIGTNTSPMAGLEGAKVTARLIKNRLDAELVGNVSIRVLGTDRPDAWEVQGRGELQLAVLVEIMRREGFEMTVGKPRVVTRTIDGRLHEPTERLTIDIPESFVGAVTQLLGERKADMVAMTNHGTGWVRARLRRGRPGSHRLPNGVPHRDPGHGPWRPACSRVTRRGWGSSAPAAQARSSPTAGAR